MTARKEWCKSVEIFKDMVDSIRHDICVTETEETWDAIAQSISNMTVLCGNGGCDFPAEIITTMREFSRPINRAMNSERTRLSGAAIDLIGVVASGLGMVFDPLLPLFFPALLALCSRTNKVIITRARTCILTIIETTQLPSILPYFLQSVKDKSSSLRLTVAEGALASMNCFNPPDLEKDARAREIEAIIRATARDASADIRKVGRKVFEAYKLLLPSRVDRFTAPLTPTMRKYLDIKSTSSTTRSHPPTLPRMPQSSHPTHTTLQTTRNPSSSTSGLRLTTSMFASHRPHPYVRCTSSPAISTTVPSRMAEHTIPAEKILDQPSRAKGSHGMLPPEYIPIRLVQQSMQISAPRSTSTIDDRKHTISGASVAAVRGERGVSTSTKIVPLTVSSGSTIRPVPISGVSGLMRRSRCASAFLAASGSASIPHRSVTVSTTDDGLAQPSPAGMPTPKALPGVVGPNAATSVARRVRVPVPVDTPNEGESEMGKCSRPTSRIDNSTSTLPTRPESSTTLFDKATEAAKSALPKPSATKLPDTKDHERVKNVEKGTRNTATASTMVLTKSLDTSSGPAAKAPGNDGKPRGITHPTLSQLSRVKAPVDRKMQCSTVIKPMWGRAAPRKLITTTASSTGKGVHRQKAAAMSSIAVVERLAKESESIPSPIRRATTPALIPFPPSPPLNKARGHTNDSERRELESVGGDDLSGDTDDMGPQEQTTTTTDTTEVEAVQTKSLPIDVSNNNFNSTPETATITSCLGPTTLDVPHQMCVTVTKRSPSPRPEISGFVSEPVTPPLQKWGDSILDTHNSLNKTPISALLSSIQRGFLFTPSSPLSPPQSYLLRVPTSESTKDLPIPLPLHHASRFVGSVVNKQGDNTTAQSMAGIGLDRPFVVLDRDELTRQALTDVEVNK